MNYLVADYPVSNLSLLFPLYKGLFYLFVQVLWALFVISGLLVFCWCDVL